MTSTTAPRRQAPRLLPLPVTAVLALVALVAVALGAAQLGQHLASQRTVGTYEVPMGTITVEGDGTARYEPSTPYLPGACAVDDTNATTGEAHRPYYACVPLHAPDGAQVEWVTADDGSATYGPGDTSPYAFDPELWGFAHRMPVAP